MRLSAPLVLLLLGLLALVFGGAPAVLADQQSTVVTAPASLSSDELSAIKEQGETHEFQAEVHRLMDIIINSLYSSREIFIREVISNAADALDKIRFQSLTDKTVLGEDDVSDLDIRISVNAEDKTITITDKGTGMRREDLINNLGVVAKSGTADFIEAVTAGADTLSLIGQFGVGFYSVYLVADEVTVVSKHNDDPKQWIWHSDADKTFKVFEDPRGNTLGRGTSVILHLKEDSSEFLDQGHLQRLVERYSSFISFPIRLLVEETITREEPLSEEEIAEEDAEKTTAAGEDDEDDDDLEINDDLEELEEEGDKPPRTKTVTEQVREWRVINDAKAIWTRSPDEITDEEYSEFYKSISKDFDDPLSQSHFTAEGEISFRSLLYVPSKADPGMYDRMYEKSKALKLYVRRVLIADEFDDLLPRYLGFIRGVVDSDDLPLNVNRESLAQSRILKVMSKKITRKALEMLRRLAEADQMEQDEDDEDAEEVANKQEEEEQGVEVDPVTGEPILPKYERFWNEFGKSIKLGVIEDRSNKNKLTKLLRFVTNKSNGKLRSFEQYVDDMPEDQKYIYYITGESITEVASSPFMEAVNRKGFEVLYLVDPLDEYVTQAITEFDGVNLMSVQKEGFKTGAEDEKYEQKLKDKYKPLTKWLAGVYGDKVAKVVVSNRIESSPCVLVTGQYGWSANMERIVRAQTFNDPSRTAHMFSRRTMEINPRHPLIRTLFEKVVQEEAGDDSEVRDLANLLHDAALVNSGFSISSEAQDFSSRIYRVVGAGLGVEVDSGLLPADEFESEPEEEEEGADVDEVDVDLDADYDDVGAAVEEDAEAEVDAEEEGDSSSRDEL